MADGGDRVDEDLEVEEVVMENREVLMMKAPFLWKLLVM